MKFILKFTYFLLLSLVFSTLLFCLQTGFHGAAQAGLHPTGLRPLSLPGDVYFGPVTLFLRAKGECCLRRPTLDTVAAPPGGKKAPGKKGLEKWVEVALILQTLGNPLKLWAWLFFAVTRPPQIAPDQCAAYNRRSANPPSIAQICCLLPLLQARSADTSLRFFQRG